MSDKLNPITREEMYLAAAAGQEVEVPKPITRKEMFLAKLVNNDAATPAAVTRSEMFIAMAAENGAGGGGGEPGNNAVVQPLEITENGTYTAPVGVDGYNPVSVNVGFDTEDVDFALDAINGEVVGETLYRVTFKNYNGAVLGFVDVYEGNDCPNPVTTGVFGTPEKEATKYIQYIHDGWSLTEDGIADPNALKAIEENRILYAVYKEETIYLGKGTVNHPNGYSGCYYIWTLNPDYVLNVESYGWSMISYDHYLEHDGVTYPPWWGYRDKITSFVCKCFNECKIGSGWLYNCTNLTDVTITIVDNTRTISLGIKVFGKCTALKKITLPSTWLIGHYCFQDSGLESIVIPATTAFIQEYAFDCDNLQSVVFERTDGWNYSKDHTIALNGKGTKPTAEQLADPTFALQSFRNGDIWINTNVVAEVSGQ